MIIIETHSSDMSLMKLKNMKSEKNKNQGKQMFINGI